MFTLIKVHRAVRDRRGFFFINAANFTPFTPSRADRGRCEELVAVLLGVGAAPGTASSACSRRLVFFAFIGFDVVATSVEEVRAAAARHLLGLGIVTALYVLVTIVMTGMVSPARRRGAPSLATAFRLVDRTGPRRSSPSARSPATTVIMVLLLGLSRRVRPQPRRPAPAGCRRPPTPRRPPLQIISGTVVALVAAFTDVGLLEEMINIGTLSAFVLVSLGIIVLAARADLPRGFRCRGRPCCRSSRRCCASGSC